MRRVGLVTLLDMDTVMIRVGETNNVVNLEQLIYFLHARVDFFIFVTSASITTRPITHNLATVLRTLQQMAGDSVPVYWGSESFDNVPMSIDKLYEHACEDKLSRIKVAAPIFQLAEFMSTVDRYVTGHLLKPSGASLQLVCPRYHAYARKLRDTFLPTMIVARRLTDFRRFYGPHDVSPADAIDRMFERSKRYLDYMVKLDDWKPFAEYARTFQWPGKQSMKNWYEPSNFIAALAVATYGRGELAIKDRIVRPEVDEPRESALRLIRVLLSDMAAKYFGPEYFPEELLDGLKKADAKLFRRQAR